MNNDVIDFLRESNNIEDEWDDLSLQQALFAWNYVIEEPILTPSVILKTHKILMLHHLVGMDKGYFRREAVYIGGREGKPWYAVPGLIDNWCKMANETVEKNKTSKTNIAKVKRINDDHVKYEHIHPFVDGNGRTGRIFLNWQRVKSGLPILVIREKEKHDYYRWF